MKDKTIDILKMCTLDDRNEYVKQLCDKYSEKAVCAKLHELARKGYIDYGVSIWRAWLTDKGKKVMEEEI